MDISRPSLIVPSLMYRFADVVDPNLLEHWQNFLVLTFLTLNVHVP